MTLPEGQTIRNLSVRSMVKAADNDKRAKYPVYTFSGRTFYETDTSNEVPADPAKTPYNPTPS